jgi:hypothetical protein
LTDIDRTTGRRRRLTTGITVVVASVAVAAAVAGVGVAGGSITAAQYQYGKVTLCHHTHSKKHPNHTIRVGAGAVAAHKRHGDSEGACAAAKKKAKHHKANHKGHKPGKSKHGSDAGNTTTTSTSTSTQPSKGHGNDSHGKSDEHGKSGEHGNGKKK